MSAPRFAEPCECHETHRVTARDRRLIQCQQPGCEAPADMCEHTRWQAGDHDGVSFFYFCDGHAAFVRAGVRGPAEAALVTPGRP